MKHALAVLVVLCAWWFETDAHALQSAPVRRFVLVVGANDGGEGRIKLRYAGSDAKAVAKVLSQLGGVEPGDAVVVLQPTSQALRRQVAALGRRIEEASTEGRTQFVFYYSGHSDETGLLLGKERFSYHELRELLHAVPADVRIGVLDSCSSGAFTRTKGGKRRAPFLAASADVAGHAFLTSSSADESAQESDRVRGSFFTHYFVSGLRGAADDNADRLVTLDEAYRFAFGEALASTESSMAGPQHAAYEIQLVGTGNLVMTDLRKTTAGLAVGADLTGRLYVRDAAGNLAVELYKPAGSDAIELALEPGKYTLVLDTDGQLRRASVVLVDGKTTKIAAADLVAFAGDENTARGATTPEYRRIPFTMSLFPPLSINSVLKGEKVENNFAINWIVGRTNRIRGVELGIGVNWATEDVHGAQLGVGANLAGTRLRGMQWSVGGNFAGEGFKGIQATVGSNVATMRRADDPEVPMHGVQLAVGPNIALGSLRGAQVSVAANVTTGTMRGVQVGSGIAHAGQLEGAQLSLVDSTGGGRGVQLGLLNVSRGTLRGAQIGLINYAEDVDASIALLPITKKGVGGTVWTDDLATFNVGLRLNARRTYGIVSVGAHPFSERHGGHWNYGVTIGGRIDVHERVFLDIDGGVRGVVPGYRRYRDMSNVFVARLMVGGRLGRRLAVFGGPTFNVGLASDDALPDFRPGYPWDVFSVRRGQSRVRLWPGFAAGMQF